MTETRDVTFPWVDGIWSTNGWEALDLVLFRARKISPIYIVKEGINAICLTVETYLRYRVQDPGTSMENLI